MTESVRKNFIDGKFAIHVEDYIQHFLLVAYLNNTGFATPGYPVSAEAYNPNSAYFHTTKDGFVTILTSYEHTTLPVVEFEDFAPVKEFFSIEPINKKPKTANIPFPTDGIILRLRAMQNEISYFGRDLEIYQQALADAMTLLNSIDFSDIYGVEQSVHGHNYRFIYTGTDLRSCINLPPLTKNDKFYEDIGFPFGSNNCSSTHIVKLESLEEAKDFLLADYKTDYEDPRLIDIAEGICTIDASLSNRSVTNKFVTLLQIPQNELTKYNALLAPAKQMIQELQNADTDYEIDFNNPFYGTSKDMRFSDLTALYEAYETYKDAMQDEPELD